MRATLLFTVAAVVSLAAAGSGHAEGVTGAQLRSLAVRAAHDPAAQARLARVDRVDGRPADLAAALRGASGAALRARIRTLGSGPLTVSGSGDARAAAERVLAQGRFHQEGLPRPLHGPLAWLGRQLAPLGRPFSWLAGKLGGAGWALTALGVAIAVAAFVFAFLATQRRAAAELLYFPGSDGAARAASPAELERLAAERERDGDFEGAVRLRFRAGLLSLDRARAIRYRPSLTTGELARTLRSDDFDGVAQSFDQIVYGGRPAAEEDARAARDGWQRIIARLRGRSAS